MTRVINRVGWFRRAGIALAALVLAAAMVLPATSANADMTCANTGHGHVWFGMQQWDYVYHTQPSGTGEWTYWKRWVQGTFFGDPYTYYYGSLYCP